MLSKKRNNDEASGASKAINTFINEIWDQLDLDALGFEKPRDGSPIVKRDQTIEILSELIFDSERYSGFTTAHLERLRDLVTRADTILNRHYKERVNGTVTRRDNVYAAFKRIQEAKQILGEIGL